MNNEQEPLLFDAKKIILLIEKSRDVVGGLRTKAQGSEFTHSYLLFIPREMPEGGSALRAALDPAASRWPLDFLSQRCHKKSDNGKRPDARQGHN